MKLTKQTLYKLILEQYEEAEQGPQLDNKRLMAPMINNDWLSFGITFVLLEIMKNKPWV